MKRLIILTILLICLATLTITLNAAENQFKLNWGGIEAIGGTQDIIVQECVKEIEEKSNGRIKIKWFEANQLGSTSEQIDGIIAGTIDILNLPANLMGNLGKDWNIDAVPFVFTNQEHRIRYNESELNKKRSDDLVSQYGIRVIASNWYMLPHLLMARKPITKVEDIKGFKMRVPESRAQFLAWKEIGATPATVSWGESYLALRQGVVEGISTDISGVMEMKFYEVAPYMIFLNTEFAYTNVLISEKIYQKLPTDLRKLLVEVAIEGGDKLVQLREKDYASLINELKNYGHGVSMLFIDNEPFKEKLKNFPEVLEKEGLVDKKTFEEIQNF